MSQSSANREQHADNSSSTERITPEIVGTFIDAVYAIAITLLALELPGELHKDFPIQEFGGTLVEYRLAFFILFAFWLQHRRSNTFVQNYSRAGLLLNAAILLFICLIPRCTTFVFHYGGDVTFGEVDKTILTDRSWTRAETVDLLFVGVVVGTDFLILLLLWLFASAAPFEEVRQVRQSKTVTSLLLLTIVLLSPVLPVQNRYVLVIVPIALFFEQEISALLRVLQCIRHPER